MKPDKLSSTLARYPLLRKVFMFKYFICGLLLFGFSSAGVAQDKFTKEVIRLTNIERVLSGVAPLEYDQSLDDSAQYWADFLGDVDDFVHFVALSDYPEYNLPDYDLDGYCAWYDRNELFGWVWGPSSENVAVQKSMRPQDVVWAWMNSPGHRSNLLNPNWTHAGVGKGPWNAGRGVCVMEFGQHLGN